MAQGLPIKLGNSITVILETYNLSKARTPHDHRNRGSVSRRLYYATSRLIKVCIFVGPNNHRGYSQQPERSPCSRHRDLHRLCTTSLWNTFILVLLVLCSVSFASYSDDTLYYFSLLEIKTEYESGNSLNACSWSVERVKGHSRCAKDSWTKIYPQIKQFLIDCRVRPIAEVSYEIPFPVAEKCTESAV